MKRPKYKSLKPGEILDLSVALSQASVLLGNASVSAIEYDDIEQMVSIATQWIEMGKMFTIECEEEHVNTNKLQYGFGPPEKPTEDEVNEDD